MMMQGRNYESDLKQTLLISVLASFFLGFFFCFQVIKNFSIFQGFAVYYLQTYLNCCIITSRDLCVSY